MKMDLRRPESAGVFAFPDLRSWKMQVDVFDGQRRFGAQNIAEMVPKWPSKIEFGASFSDDVFCMISGHTDRRIGASRTILHVQSDFEVRLRSLLKIFTQIAKHRFPNLRNCCQMHGQIDNRGPHWNTYGQIKCYLFRGIGEEDTITQNQIYDQNCHATVDGNNHASLSRTLL